MTLPLPGSVIAGGKYFLLHEIARGGMGSVFAAQHVQLDSPVAIKFIDPAKAESAEARVRFEREARAAAQFRSPNIVQVFDHGVDNDLPYIVMELLHGEDLGERLRRMRRLSLRDTARILVQVAKGLRRPHEAGIIHRDIKPGNIFLAKLEDGDEEVVKILDFGLAKALAPELNDEVTRTGVVIGSPQYMSPEQVRGRKNVDQRSDVWAVGVVLYRCLTGVLPFRSDQVGDLVVQICTDPIKPPSAMVPDLPQALDAFFERALARDIDARYATLRDLTADFMTIVLAADPSAQSQLGPAALSATLPPTSAPSPGPASRPSGYPAEADRRFTFNSPPLHDPDRPPQLAAPTPVPSSSPAPPEGARAADAPINTVEGTTIAGVPAGQPKVRPRALLAASGAGVLFVLLIVALLRLGSSGPTPDAHGAAAQATASSPAAVTNEPQPAAAASHASAENNTAIIDDAAERAADAPDAGKDDAGGGPAKSSVQPKKRRNFGY